MQGNAEYPSGRSVIHYATLSKKTSLLSQALLLGMVVLAIFALLVNAGQQSTTFPTGVGVASYPESGE